MFKTFPEFSKLTLGDRQEYEALIRDYPPISEISFVTLATWWSYLEPAALATLNKNLVLSYWIPGDDETSGLSLVGTRDIDESICEIFDYQKLRGDKPRLVHVPEFVVSNMRYPEMFTFTPERKFDECIVTTAALSSISNASHPIQEKITQFLRNHQGYSITLQQLDLTKEENQVLLLDKTERWSQAGTGNEIPKLLQEITPQKIRHAEELGIKNYCLYIQDELQGIFLYHQPHNKDYVIACFGRVNGRIKNIMEFLVYSVAQKFEEEEVSYINLDFDLGLPFLRANKLSLGPVNFFRKYTIEPQS
jgi:hypothetical protein